MLSRLLPAFARNEQGSMAIIFAFVMIPVIGLIGAAVDYTRATSAKARLQGSLDAAVLMTAHDAQLLSDSQIIDRIRKAVVANLDGKVSIDPARITVNRLNQVLVADAKTDVPTSILKVASIDTIAISANAQATWGTNKIEIVMALDNTGSMASSGKMTQLKIAAKNLVDMMAAVATDNQAVKVGIVPFATQVRLDTSLKNENWIRFNPSDADVDLRVSKTTWTGCIFDRDQNYDTNDIAPDPGVSATLYPAAVCKATGLQPLQSMLELSSTNNTNRDKLKDVIEAMQASGNTNVGIGMAWGATLVSKGAPFSQGLDISTPGLNKYVILLTDGDNTENRFSSTQSAIDARTKLACTNTKAAGIRVYTIRVIDGNATLLRDCATDPSMYYSVTTASQLTPVFQKIAAEIAAVRITH